MSSENIELKSKESFDTLDFRFISSAQFIALVQHFEKLLDSTRENESLERMRIEMAELLKVFQSCYKESERKSHRILELQASKAIANQKLNTMYSLQDSEVKDLRNAIKNLQQDLDEANEQRRELLEFMKSSKQIEKQNKTVQVREDFFEELTSQERPESILADESKNVKDANVKRIPKEIQSAEMKNDRTEQKETEFEETNVNTLKKNLQILVADIKLTRQNISQLRKEIRKKDIVISELNKDVKESEKMLSKAEKDILQIQKPLEMKIAKYEKDLSERSEKLDYASEELKKERLLNITLSQDTILKGTVIRDLKTELEILESEKESALRLSYEFEKHLAKSQSNVEELVEKVKSLQNEIEVLQRQSETEMKKLTPSEKVKVIEISDQEKTIKNLHNLIELRDQALCQVKDELRATTDALQSLKKDFSVVNKEKSLSECEILELRKKLKDKMTDIKQMKRIITEKSTELEETKWELSSQFRKHQQAVDKRNKLQSMYNRLKFLNDKQKKENTLLEKRLGYLVKMLRDKNMEIEKVLTWKRRMY